MRLSTLRYKFLVCIQIEIRVLTFNSELRYEFLLSTLNKLRGFEYTNFGTVRLCVSYEEKELRILCYEVLSVQFQRGLKLRGLV